MTMSKSSFLITRPNHDLVTNYLYYWTEKIVKEALSKNISLYDLKKKKANRRILNSYIKKNNPQILLFNGHGDEERIGGIDDQILVGVKDNENILIGRIIYARSCKSAKRLGISCVKKGAKAFIGYKDDFILISKQEKATKPLTDKIAGYFLQPSNLVILALLKGNSPIDSHKRSQEDSIKKMKYLMSGKASKDEEALIPFLWRNMKAHVVYIKTH